ncbi:hypothetical protein [Campylobacter ureolyticus]|uniref:Highly acidic protein n=1 Tax=Campylobacter ureolyticus TaxID=827 RepID=A0AAE7EB05_9BACT|nr:hypothetical protein [Campylobacter ureolyticus]MCR8684475.1 hypothetical protein [Campylobacter ureolyticus]QKF84872.1 hypothetical protein CURT_1421 [Campylobacter ureolyticus]QQY34961.1 hypothetical protein I6I59_05350 [Campylobacter ureolyticus]SUX20814.1 highly acidic protein [Campylobacter ureolyticus]
MKILLKSENPAVLSIVEICCERAGFDRPYTKDDGEFDLVIQDCDKLEDITDNKGTLFLIPRNFENEVGNVNFIIKPFLPTELIKFLKDYESKANFNEKKFSLSTEESINNKTVSLVSEENLNNKTISLKDEDKANELEEIGSLIDEIDEMDNLKTNDEALEEDSLDEDKLDDLLKNLDDDVPLDELLNELDVDIDDELSCSKDKKEEVSDFEIKPISIDSECQDENLDNVIENHDKEKKLEQEEHDVEKTEANKELATIPLVMHNEKNLEDEISKEDEESKNIEEVLKNEDLKTIDELSFFDEYDEVQPHNPPLTALDIEELDDRCDDDTNNQDFKDEELNNYDIDDEFEIKFDECRNQDKKSCETKDDVCKNQGFVGLNDLLNKKENETSNEDLKKIAKKEMEKELEEALKNGKFKEIFKDMQIKIKISFKED